MSRTEANKPDSKICDLSEIYSFLDCLFECVSTNEEHAKSLKYDSDVHKLLPSQFFVHIGHANNIGERNGANTETSHHCEDKGAISEFATGKVN